MLYYSSYKEHDGFRYLAKNMGVIVLKGNRYDAISGQFIGKVKSVGRRTRAKSTQTGQTIDGFVRKTAQNVHRGAQRSRTLMRTAVNKPPVAKNSGPAKPTALIFSERPVPTDRQRQLRAKSAVKHSNVSRFSPPSQAVEHRPTKSSNPSAGYAPARALVQATAAAPPLPSMITSVSHHQLERLLDHALFRADAHRRAQRGYLPGQRRWQRVITRPKWLSIGIGALAVAMVAAFLAWQNVPQLSMRLAASRAHVSASVPSYIPSGFSYSGPINYSEGSVSIDFKTTSNNGSSFTLTQQKSTENSASLAANSLPGNSQVQTSQVSGSTVYIYGAKNDATWVNHGVRYTIVDKANLKSDQILKIAGSL